MNCRPKNLSINLNIAITAMLVGDSPRHLMSMRRGGQLRQSNQRLTEVGVARLAAKCVQTVGTAHHRLPCLAGGIDAPPVATVLRNRDANTLLQSKHAALRREKYLYF
jgi:hypothetical protein